MLLSVSLILAYSPGFTQQPAGKPVLSADPALPPTAPAPAASVPAGPVAVDPNYVIGPDDSLKINVWNEPKFSDSLPVRPDGMITLPLVGDIRAAGRTPMQLGADITEILKKEITDPSVTVSILMINSKRRFISCAASPASSRRSCSITQRQSRPEICRESSSWPAIRSWCHDRLSPQYAV